jgi:hypothetical protein
MFLSWKYAEFYQIMSCNYWDGHKCFIIHSVELMCHTYWFEYIEPSFHLRGHLEIYLYLYPYGYRYRYIWKLNYSCWLFLVLFNCGQQRYVVCIQFLKGCWHFLFKAQHLAYPWVGSMCSWEENVFCNCCTNCSIHSFRSSLSTV